LRRLLLLTLCWSAALTLLVVFTGGSQSPYLLFAVGVLTGFLGVNVAALRLALIRWSIYKEIIDWAKVESLAAIELRPNRIKDAEIQSRMNDD
jgi:hypothetical protein